MKKLISLLALSVVLVACGKEEEPAPPTETTTEIIELDKENEEENDK